MRVVRYHGTLIHMPKDIANITVKAIEKITAKPTSNLSTNVSIILFYSCVVNKFTLQIKLSTQSRMNSLTISIKL